MTTPFRKAIEKFEQASEDYNAAKEAALRHTGWIVSCDYPGGLWLWSKQFPESTVQTRLINGERLPHEAFTINGATTEVALMLQEAWDLCWE